MGQSVGAARPCGELPFSLRRLKEACMSQLGARWLAPWYAVLSALSGANLVQQNCAREFFCCWF